MCCKELGHAIKDCPRDPNLRSKGDPDTVNDDYQRILKIKENKKFFVDTAITTTHFLKKCIKVRKPAAPLDAAAKEGIAIIKQKLSEYEGDKFKRGAMMFEDFNYNQFNKYILLDENQEYYEEDDASADVEA